jgi:hypothetical protein
MKPHQTAKAAVAKMAVMAIEISNEIAASLIQSVTSSPYPVGSIAQVFQRLDCQSVPRLFSWSYGLSRGTLFTFFHRCVDTGGGTVWKKSRLPI